MFRSQGEASRHATKFLCHQSIKNVGCPDESGNKRRARAHIEIARGIDLLNASIIENRHTIGHR